MSEERKLTEEEIQKENEKILQQIRNTVNSKKIVKNVALYIRVSSKEQVMYGYSLEAQRNALLKYAEDNNLNVVGIYTDEGLSAHTGLENRKALWQMMEDIQEENKKIDKVIFIRIDRWMRSVEDYFVIQKILDKHNVTWECTQDNYTSHDKFKVNLYLTLAQEESDKMGERIKFVFRDKLKKKQAISGAVPRGYKLDENKHFVIDEEEAEVIRTMFDKYEETGSVYVTLQYMRDLGVKRLDLVMVRRYLKNEIFIGNYVHKEYGVFEEFCEPIITKEQFFRVNKMIKRNVKKQSYKKVKKEYIFQGMLYCNECGRKITSSFYQREAVSRVTGEKKIQSYKTYRCPGHSNMNGCNMKYNVSEAVVERNLLQNLRPLLEEHLEKIKVVDVKETKPKIDYAKKINELESDLDRISEMYRKKMMREKQYVKQFEEISKEIEECEKQVKIELTSNKKVVEKVNNKKVIEELLNKPIEQIYNNFTIKEKRTFWLSILDKAFIDRNNTIPKFL